MTITVGASKHFPLPLVGRWDLSGDRFTTIESFIYDDEEKGIYILVPADTATDFSSIPRAVWWWFPKTAYPAAGLVHDAIYRHPYAQIDGVRVRLKRAQCDDIWRRILHLSGCRKSKRLAAWVGLRAGGWVAWNKYRKAERGE